MQTHSTYAAHVLVHTLCVKKTDPTSNMILPPNNSSSINIETIISHPEYNSGLAIVKLAGETKFINDIYLPFPGYVRRNTLTAILIKSNVFNHSHPYEFVEGE